MSNAIGTLVRTTLKKTRLSQLEEKDRDKTKEITKQILEILFKYKESEE